MASDFQASVRGRRDFNTVIQKAIVIANRRLSHAIAVRYLESMGLPEPYLKATRKQVEQGKLDLRDSLEYKLYSRNVELAEGD